LPVVLGKEYSFNEWESLTKDYKELIIKMKFTFDTMISDYNTKYSEHNLIMRMV
jgi:hypothetical protein